MRQAITDENGFFLFDNLVSAWPYFLNIPSTEFGRGGALRGLKSLPGVDAGLSADDDHGEDGQDVTEARKMHISSRVISVVKGAAPMNEPGLGGEMDAGRDEDVDLTVDFGFYRPMAVGNLVFLDANGNGRADPGEGINGVKVQIYRAWKKPGVDAPDNEVATGADGRYLLDDVAANAEYFLHVPAAEFAPGRPLAGAHSVAGADADLVDDDAGEDGLDVGRPAVDGVSTAVFIVSSTDGAPTGATGEKGFMAEMDDAEDARVDLARDFGFVPAAETVGVGNLVFVDENGDGLAQSSEGRDGVIVQLFLAGSDPTAQPPLAESMTVGGGRYYFGNLAAGRYFIFVPASQFAESGRLKRCVPLPVVVADADDDAGQDALSAAAPHLTGVRTADFTLAPASAPSLAAFEKGLGSAEDDARDAAVDLTVDLGFLRSMSVGNLVFLDANKNGKADVGEGQDGVTVQLFRAGDDPASAPPRAQQVTADKGRFLFSDVAPGHYFLRIPPTQFHSGAALHQMISISGAGRDDGVDDDDNGLDAASPAEAGVQSLVFELFEGMEALDAGTESGVGFEMDGLADDDGDLTLDFGFGAAEGRLGVGNLVYLDANGDGIAQAVEGVDGVTVQLYAAGSDPASAVPVAKVMTTDGGRYFLGDLGPGSYFIFIPAAHFASSGVLARCLPLPLTAGADDESYQVALPALAPHQTGVRTGDFTLAAIKAPIGQGGETGPGSAVDLTVDLGFHRSESMSVGNLVFVDANANRLANSGEGRDGVTVQLFHEGDAPDTVPPRAELVTAEGGRFVFSGLAPGRYFMRVPPDQFQKGAPLYGAQTLKGAGADDGADDDDNGVDVPEPHITGVRSMAFQLTAGAEPVDASTETGIGAEMGGYPDENGDMTLDFGFVGACPAITLQPLASHKAFKNLPFEHYCSVAGGTGPYRYALVGDLPPGLVFDKLKGRIGGTPQMSGTFHFYVGVMDNAGCNGTQDVTLTVTEPSPILAVGNTVFVDGNGNGCYDVGEGISGVRVELVPQSVGAAVTSTVSGADGHYLFEKLPPGNYLLRVPASMFVQGAPLYQMKSVTGVDGGFDDNVGEDGHDAKEPAVTGVVTDIFSLIPNQAPTADRRENGRGAAADDESDAQVDLTRDFGFVRTLQAGIKSSKSHRPHPAVLEGDLFSDISSEASQKSAKDFHLFAAAPKPHGQAQTIAFACQFSRLVKGICGLSYPCPPSLLLPLSLHYSHHEN